MFMRVVLEYLLPKNTRLGGGQGEWCRCETQSGVDLSCRHCRWLLKGGAHLVKCYRLSPAQGPPAGQAMTRQAGRRHVADSAAELWSQMLFLYHSNNELLPQVEMHCAKDKAFNSAAGTFILCYKLIFGFWKSLLVCFHPPGLGGGGGGGGLFCTIEISEIVQIWPSKKLPDCFSLLGIH